MRILAILVLCCASLVQAEDFTGKPKEFDAAIKTLPRLSVASVGTIQTPLPTRSGFQVPGRWVPVKVVDDKAVYLVKDAYNFLKPNPRDNTNSTYVLWANPRGLTPEIILWPCASAIERQKIVDHLEQLRAERRAEAIKKREESRKNRETREEERRARAAARQSERSRKFKSSSRRYAASPDHHKMLLGMQQPLADAVLDRVQKIIDGETAKGKASVFSTSDEDAMNQIRQNIMAVMALQLQMRDLEWCDAIEKHLAPNMWAPHSRNKLKNSAPSVVVPWLLREVEQQAEAAEALINMEQYSKEEHDIRHLEMGEDPRPTK